MKGSKKRCWGIPQHKTSRKTKRWYKVVQRAALQILEVTGDEVGVEKNGGAF
jgi:hypothetical protein